MTIRLKKKNNSSLSKDYVNKFISSIENKLYIFNVGFLTPYKEKLNNLDKTIIQEINKDLKSPVLLIKNALDDLWNYHWILGQQDVINSENKSSNYSSETHSNITFAQTVTELKAEKEQLQNSDKRIKRIKRELKAELNSKTKNSSNINDLVNRLRDESTRLEQFLGNLRKNTADNRNKQFASVEIRVRDLQETIRVLELQAKTNNQQVETSNNNNIDILNSSEFGTIYQDKRTLLLSQNYSQDYKDRVVKKIQNYFNNTNGERPKNREQTLFDSLTTKEDTALTKRYKAILQDTDKLESKDRAAKKAIDSFVSNISTKKQLQDFIKNPTSDIAINTLKASTKGSKLYKTLANELITEVKSGNINGVRSIIKTAKEREKYNIKVGNTYKLGAYDSFTDTYKTLEEIEDGASNVFAINRIRQIANTEISLAYNLGRLKKLQELGYTRVKVVAEKENSLNREAALNRYGSLWKVYKLSNKEELMPLLCNFCAEMDGTEFDINSIYEGKVNTEFNPRYSKVPPFHVACWCYFVGTDNKKALPFALPQSKIDDKLLLSSVGLVSVVAAYLAFNKFGGNKTNLVEKIQETKKVIKTTAKEELTKVQNVRKNIIEEITESVDNVTEEVLDRPKINIPLKQLEEINKVTDEVFEEVEKDTKRLLRIPINLSIKEPELVEELVLNDIDQVVSNKSYKTLNLTPKTFNEIIEEIPDYVKALQPIVKAREDYYRLRNIIYDTSIALETRQALYSQYISSRSNYDSLITKHLSDTRSLKNTVNNVQSQISIDANKQLLSNRNRLPESLTLEEALKNVRSRQALTLTDNQLKNIRSNLLQEQKGLREKIGVESKVLDSTLDGIDTQQKTEVLRKVSNDISTITDNYVSKTKTLNNVVTNIDSIKKELNNISKTKSTIRSISSDRIRNGTLLDRRLVIDTQETYIKKVLEQQKIISTELNKLPTDINNVDNFVNLYRSEIIDKVKNDYPYSKNLWNNKEITQLDKQYKNASDLITIRNTYQSYLDETEDMLSKLSNFETTIVDNTIKFSDNYSNDIIINRELFNKISKLPNIKDIVFK